MFIIISLIVIVFSLLKVKKRLEQEVVLKHRDWMFYKGLLDVYRDELNKHNIEIDLL